ncbi:MAG: hypothetical protein RJB31_1236 [Bacteroidota bacterium]
MRLFILFFLVICSGSTISGIAQTTPLEYAMAIGDKLIKETPYAYRATLKKPQQLFKETEVIDFGRSIFSPSTSAAIAYTCLTSKAAQTIHLQLAFKGKCRIWLNGQLIYDHQQSEKLAIKYGERSIELQDSLVLTLKKGTNDFLLLSEATGPQWKFYMQVPQTNGRIMANEMDYPEIGLRHLSIVDSTVANLSNWLILGPIPVSSQLSVVNEIIKHREIGKMYPGMSEQITWKIPYVDILGDVIDPKIWGTNYNWNYHNGGVAWAMQHLSKSTGFPRFAQYSNDYCEFHLSGSPFVKYQVETLDALNSANSLFFNTQLLDFTLAPSLPFLNRLIKDHDDFRLKNAYTKHVDSMIFYARSIQVRMPGSAHYVRNTPIQYTTWVDDMFMGIPFLVMASSYVSDHTIKDSLLNDAANQVLCFNQEVFDEKAGLYRHAKYSTENTKMPFWSRANGWGIWATTEVLQALPKQHPSYSKILSSYKKHIEALVALQDGSGFWLNVLDRKDAPKETSGTAIFTMAIARGIRNGWLDGKKYAPAVLKAWEALKTKIDAGGSVGDICMGTMCSDDVNYYMNRPLLRDDTHGIFAVLFACIELDTFFKNRNK